jgi:hypothetical protein
VEVVVVELEDDDDEVVLVLESGRVILVNFKYVWFRRLE